MSYQLIDSHCHLDKLDLTNYKNNFSRFMEANKIAGIKRMLCVSLSLESYPTMVKLIKKYNNIDYSVGVHPNNLYGHNPTVEELVRFSNNSIAIGETGLDYFYNKDKAEQQERQFRIHIRAAREVKKPLIIHTRYAGKDTLRIMKEENADEIGGVIHCFTESQEMARKVLGMGFHISFSGIITFSNSRDLRHIVRQVPINQILIETDSPYLAPVPYRGKQNEPKYVIKVAEMIAKLKNIDLEEIIQITKDNYYRLFLL